MRLTDREILKVVIRAKDRPLSIPAMAEQADCSESTVRRAIARMEERRILTHVRGGHRIPSEYQVNLCLVPEEIRRDLT